MAVNYDNEWQAACHLLLVPRLRDRTAAYIHPDKREIDWRGLQDHPWSTGERLLVDAAFALWRGEGADFGRTVGYLDPGFYQRVIEAAGIYRGTRPDLAIYPGGW